MPCILLVSVLIARSHSDDNHVNATATCMSCMRMHYAQARPPMSCIPLVLGVNWGEPERAPHSRALQEVRPSVRPDGVRPTSGVFSV